VSNNVPSSDIDVRKYRNSLIEWMRSYPQFTDYDYEGSNLSVLIGLLAYNTYNMAHYNEMVGNEAWTDTSELRQSLVSHATDLNYLPRSRTSAFSIIEVEVVPNDTPQSIVLPKHYRFKSSDNRGNTIYFTTDQDYIATRDNNGRYVFSDVTIYQGDIVREVFDISGITITNGLTFYQNPIVISSSNIDVKSLEVRVGVNATDDNPTLYTYAKTLANTDADSLTYFLRGIYDDQYAIEFGDGTFGAPLVNNQRVHISYRDTAGALVQGNYTFTKTASVGPYPEVIVNSSTRVQGGFERESIEEIRRNAPRHFQVQDRATTSIDYEIIVKENFPNIQSIHAFGGEEVQQYGKVMIVLKPFGTSGLISNIIKNQIVSLLKTKNIVPEPIIIDPSYYHIGITGNVYYRGDLARITENQIKTNIVNDLINLNNNMLGDFNVRIYQSAIAGVIDKSNESITGNDITFTLKRRWQPGLNITETLSFNPNNPTLKPRDGIFRTADVYTIVSTPFTVFINDALETVVVQDDGLGNLFYHLINTDGTKTKVGQSVGTIDYDTGAVKLVATVYEYAGYIEFTISLAKDTIDIIQDSFCVIDGPDININLVRL
jgi:hypothetical protein